MVKQAEKKERRNPLLPIYGIVVAVGLAAVAWLLAEALIDNVRFFQAFREGRNATIGQIATTLVLWLIMIGVAYLLVSLIVGADPTDKRKKEIGLPERNIRRRRR